MSDPLSSQALLSIVQSRVAASSDANVCAANPTSVIALVVHAIHTALGFRQIRPRPAPTGSDNTENTSQDPNERNKITQEWWDRNCSEESFEFQYRHEQSSLVFQVRIGRLGGRTVINAVAVEDDKTATLDLTTSDYIGQSNCPVTLSGEGSISSLETVFNSSARLNDLVRAYKTQIIQKLLPGLVKPGYAEERNNDDSNTGGTAPPPAAGPSQPRPDPSFPDHGEGRIGAPPQLPRPGYGQNPLEIGRSDLDPLGGQIGRMPGAGGDGMFVGPDHPLFGRERDANNPLGGPQRGPWGGDGFLPPIGAPPGARFDPISPFGNGGPGGNAGGQPRRNWGDELPPPGFDNDHGFNPLNPGGQGGFGGGFQPPRGGGAGGGFGNMFM